MRKCTNCEIEKPLSNFEKGRAICKPCRLLKKKETYQKAKAKGIRWGGTHKSHPILKRLATNANSTARQRGGIGRVTAEELEKYLGEPKTCCLCGGNLTLDEVQIEHVHPIIKGGTNTIDNLAYIHPRCNRLKSGDTKEELKILLENILKNL